MTPILSRVLSLSVLLGITGEVAAQDVFARYRHAGGTEETFGPFASVVPLNLGAIPSTVEVVWVWATNPNSNLPRVVANGARQTKLQWILANPALQASFPTDPEPPMFSEAGKDWAGLDLTGDLATNTTLAAAISGDLTGGIVVGQVFRLQATRISSSTTGGRILAAVEARAADDPSLWPGDAIRVIAVSHGTSAGGTITATNGSIFRLLATAFTGNPSIQGYVKAHAGGIGHITARRGTIEILDTVGISCRDGIELIQANGVAANIAANFGGGPGNLGQMRVVADAGQGAATLKGYSGTLTAATIGAATVPTALEFSNTLAPTSCTISTVGDLLSDIVCNGTKPTVLTVNIGGNFRHQIRSEVTLAGMPPETVVIQSVQVAQITQPYLVPDAIRPQISATIGRIAVIDFVGEVLPGRLGSPALMIDCLSIGVLRFRENAFANVGVFAIPTTRSVACDQLVADSDLAGMMILRPGATPGTILVKGHCSAGLLFALGSGQAILPISIGGGFVGTIAVLPQDYVLQPGSSPARSEPIRQLASLVAPCAVGQTDATADFDGTVSIPVQNATLTQTGLSVNLWHAPGRTHGHLSSRPADPGRLPPVGGGAVGAYPYALHAADCSPRPVPGKPPKAAYAERPFAPLYPDEEPCDSEVNRYMIEPWAPPAQPIALRFDGPVRSTLAIGSPFVIEHVEYVNGQPIYVTIDPAGYRVTVKRPNEPGQSREASILGEAGAVFAYGLHRVRLRTDVSNPLVSECAAPCPTGFAAAPVRSFEYFFNLQQDCGQDGIPGDGGPGGCPCDYYTPCAVGDFNQDGGWDGADVTAFFDAWENAMPNADVNSDGGIDGGDIAVFMCWWQQGGCP